MEMNGLKIDSMNGVDVIKAPVSSLEIKEDKENTSKDTVESTQEETAKEQKKHVIKYIGNGEYIDSTGYKWHKNDERIMSDEEYKSRVDLHFMVKYGSMSHTVVDM